jgi:putative nucleotidyltransferase with HDIG domain
MTVDGKKTGSQEDRSALPTFREVDDYHGTQATEFIIRFYRLLRGSTLYDRNNANIHRLAEECQQIINSLIHSEGQIVLKVVRDNFFFNNLRVAVKADKYPIFKNLGNELVKRWIGELEFSGEIKKEDLKEFSFLLAQLEEKTEGNYLFLRQALETRGILSIGVDKLEFFKEEDLYIDPEKQKRHSKELYFKAIKLVKELVEGVRQQKVLNIRKAKHLMQNAVNCIVQDESALLGLANIKNYDEYTFNHSVNVSIYAIALGQRIGIPKKQLSHLGMAALFHDLGKTRIPKEILNKTERLEPQEWMLLRSHPVMGAEMVIRMKEWGELTTRMVNATFEHHLKYDLTGYPKLARKRNITLFGRIITLVDFYDALIRPRVYRRYPFISEKILGIMLERSGKDFDPALVKVLINMIGIYPLGTLVLLSTNEMAIVVQSQEEPELIDRPKVCLLQFGDGQYRKGEIVDLREIDEGTQTFRRAIVKTLDPNEYNLNVAEFLI